MDYKLKECLSGDSGNYLFPFFIVQDTESTARMLDELHAIYNAGIRSAIIHSHEYENFCEEQWWNDVRALMEEAKRLGMKLWILDTKRFPSGNVGKLLEKKFPEAARSLRTRSLVYNDQKAELIEMEKQGNVLIIAPDSIGHMRTLNKEKNDIRELYIKGYRDARAIRDFLKK